MPNDEYRRLVPEKYDPTAKVDSVFSKMRRPLPAGMVAVIPNWQMGMTAAQREKVATLEYAISLVTPLMRRYEGQGEGGTAEFNIAMQALRECKR